MWRSVASNALTLFIVILVVVAGVLAWGRQAYNGPGPLSQAICFRVEKGASLSQVSRGLEAQGAVSDARIFRIASEYNDKARALKFGSYLIQPGSSMAQVVEQLTDGGQSTCGREVNFRIGVTSADIVLRELDPATNRYVEVLKFDPAVEAAPAEYLEAATADDIRLRLTVAEGVTSWQVVEGLKRADFLEGKIDQIPAEGSLAPESYEVDRGADRQALLGEMANRQTLILAELWATRAAALPYDTPETAMIMASIVEKETGIAEERPRVASVFINRLRQGMKLQTDPTVHLWHHQGRGRSGSGLAAKRAAARNPLQHLCD